MSLSGKTCGFKKSSETEFRFSPPPEAPVFCPTEDEWRNPLAFIRSVRPEAERWGICKIRPPAAWQPPFALDVDRFQFTPRIQRLNELEAKTRVKLNFLDSIAKFWELQGSTLKIPVLERRALDLCALHRMVSAAGGHDAVTRARRWSRLASRLGYSHAAGALLRVHYQRILYPFDIFTKQKLAGPKVEAEDVEDRKPARRMRRTDSESDTKRDPENPELRRLQFYGAGPKMAGFVPLPTDPFDPLSKYACLTCGSGDVEESMLLCDGCDDSYHTFCLTPPLTSIPVGDWRCPRCVALEVSKPQEAFGFEQARREYTLQQFGEMADQFKSDYFNAPVHRVAASAVEAEFWRVVSSIDEDVTVEYGADLHTMDHGSGFPTQAIAGMHPVDQAYADSPWNLNNLPTLAGSVLSHINADISGMKVPWMYVGMCFAAFCWHNEDHWSYSINYLHWGEPKTWYGVSGGNAEAFESTMRAAAPELFQSQPDLLHQLVTIMNPNILTAAGVPVCRTDQQAGEFVVTFPRAYHAGFNQGYNFAEAVNFAPADWLRMGRECVSHYSNLRRFCVFAHDELVCKMAANHATLDPNEATAAYQDMRWMVGAERALRKTLLEWGVTSSKHEAFEALPDDERQCHACKTTCFLSAVTCSCNDARLVCLRHYDQLCSCVPKNHTLRYRHTLDELPALLAQLSVAAGAWEAWSKAVRSALEDGARRPLPELRTLADEARLRRFPRGALPDSLDALVGRADKLLALAHRIARDSPPLQVSPVELRGVHAQLADLPCAELPETAELAELIARDAHSETPEQTTTAVPKQEEPEADDVEDGAAWLTRASAALAAQTPGQRDVLHALLSSADALPAHSEEVADALESVRAALARGAEVEARATAALAPPFPEDALDLAGVRELLEEARTAPTSAGCLEKLRTAVRGARAWSREAAVATRGGELLPYLDYLRRLVAAGDALPVRLRALPELRARLAAAERWRRDAAKVFLAPPAQPDQLLRSLAPKTMFGWEALERPASPAGPPTVGGVVVAGDASGTAVQAAFRDAAALELRAARRHAAAPFPAPGAPCCTCREPRGREPTRRCLVCFDFFHVACILPEQAKLDAFVCVGCCLTRRPGLKPVLRLLVSLRALAARLPEGDALQSLADRALGWQDRARSLLATPPLLRALTDTLANCNAGSELADLTALALRDTRQVARVAEALDRAPTVQTALRGASLSAARSLLREGLLLEVSLDERRVLARLARNQDTQPTPTKRPRSPRETAARGVKGRRRASNVRYAEPGSEEEEVDVGTDAVEGGEGRDEEEFCAAAHCAGRHVHWVQCDSHCKRWFHLQCVGLGETVIKEDDVFFCPTCRVKDDPQEKENGKDAVDSSPSTSSYPAEI